MKKINVLEYLKRTDKWYLGGGNRLIWTPPFPVWLDYPGFWDKAHYYNYEIEPVFTWTILDENGREIPLKAMQRVWDPSKLVCEYREEGIDRRTEDKERSTDAFRFAALDVQESKCCLPVDVLASVIRLKNNSAKSRKLNLIAWTVQPNHTSKKISRITGLHAGPCRILFKNHLCREGAPILPVYCAFGSDRKIKSFSVNLSEGAALQPHWRHTPFAEKFINGKLPDEIKLSGINADGLIFIAVHLSAVLRAGSEETLSVFFASAPSRGEASRNFSSASKLKDPAGSSEKNWSDYFSSVPYFQSSDERLTRYYWYRWYGIKLMTMHGREGNYKHPAICEGIGYFRAPISYSAMCHMLENRWRRDPAPAQGSLLTFIENQRKDGGFRGYIDVNYYRSYKFGAKIVEPFYHADWGNAVRKLYLIHPDKKFLKKAYRGLVRYARYFDRERDKERSGMYDIDNHYETGQEYMNRYLAVDGKADRDNWGKVFRLKGVDATVYIYELKRALSWMAGELDLASAVALKWRSGAEKIKKAILEKMWDPADEMFYDVNPKTGKRTGVKAAVCFYPYMTDIVSEKHLRGLKKHLFNRREFWTPFPVPSSSADDDFFSAEAEWKGKRMNCPWNGRVWPMANSHIAEALAGCAIRFENGMLRTRSAEFINKFIGMMFFNGDPAKPNCFEHYNPHTGDPSTYRGVDDYQHSWVADLMIRYVAGVRCAEGKIFIDAFPFKLDYFLLDNLFIRGRQFKIEKRSDRITVWVDGKKRGITSGDKQVEIPLKLF